MKAGDRVFYRTRSINGAAFEVPAVVTQAMWRVMRIAYFSLPADETSKLRERTVSVGRLKKRRIAYPLLDRHFESSKKTA